MPTMEGATTSSTQKSAKKTILSPRSLVNAGVFSVLYVVVVYAFGMLGFISPIFMIIGSAISMICGAVVMMLYIAKTPYPGAFTIVMTVFGIVMTFSGEVWYSFIGGFIVGIIADAIAASNHFRGKITNAAAYSAINLIGFVMWSPIFLNAEAYYQKMNEYMNVAWAEQFRHLFSPATVTVLVFLLIIIAFPVALWAQTLLKKHFVRAGVVQ